MDLPANRPQVGGKKFRCPSLKCTVQYKAHLVTICTLRERGVNGRLNGG